MSILLFVLMIAVVMLLWLVEVKLGAKALMGRNAGARVTGPLFSMTASGTIGKAVTYGTWKGRAWARVWFKPQNPKSDKQVNIRTALTLLVALWQGKTDPSKLAWNYYADPFSMSGFNKFVSRGLKAYIVDPGIEVVPTSVTQEGAPPADIWAWNPV